MKAQNNERGMEASGSFYFLGNKRHIEKKKTLIGKKLKISGFLGIYHIYNSHNNYFDF